MDTNRYSEIDEAISYIHQNIYEPLPLTQLANHVGYSPYHFTRIFKERMGISPLYYASSVRLQKAKELLLRTNMSIRDVGLEIGQQSLGTFTTRFTERVGVTPSHFRNSTLHAENDLRSLQKLSNWQTSSTIGHPYSTLEGTVRAEAAFEGVVLIGLFTKPIPEGNPRYGTILSSLGHFSLTDVKPGTYFLMATSVSWEMKSAEFMLPYTTLRTRSKAPITVSPESRIPYQEVVLHTPLPDDPPILISLPLLMSNFLSRMMQANKTKR
ncbi:helix-turn-helix transcriptional regulator [Cohnella mopanensis]|uniref:helix-turn-helix transcriptional regulator n=1 Tax=Cohnella mopanensis TaxID=2911966 RepID=UPI001EF99065|nr:helix-turn-helix transcriptional regulator [Cohnella mopanensis]